MLNRGIVSSKEGASSWQARVCTRSGEGPSQLCARWVRNHERYASLRGCFLLINANGSRLGHFSEYASEAVLARVIRESKNRIFEYECLAILGALNLWGSPTCGANVVIFTDNEAAPACMIVATFENRYGEAIVGFVHETCDSRFLNVWFEGVKTTSNIADAPWRDFSSNNIGERFNLCLGS